MVCACMAAHIKGGMNALTAIPVPVIITQGTRRYRCIVRLRAAACRSCGIPRYTCKYNRPCRRLLAAAAWCGGLRLDGSYFTPPLPLAGNAWGLNC